MRPILLLGAIAMALSLPSARASCGAAFCTINTSWDAHGAWLEEGGRLDLRYESITQDQPRSGRRDVAVGQIPHHHDEVRTENNNLLATWDHTFNADWGVNLLVPLVERFHDHIHNHLGGKLDEQWDFAALGDVRIVARRRLATTEDREALSLSTSGINFGLKLPTGRYNVRNAAGDPAERSLQPGSGTTDAVLGGYYSKSLPERDLSWFAQGLAQVPLNERRGYRPGSRVSLDVGARYAMGDRVGLMLQLNTLLKGRDRGAGAEPDDSGGSFLFVSPGVSYAFTRAVQAYAFVQLPLYQYVNGVQLVPRYALAVGVNTRF